MEYEATSEKCFDCIEANRECVLMDKDLFQQPLREQDCPICFLRLPTLHTGQVYMTCCGKIICSGCLHAPVYDNNGNTIEEKCPFCRTPFPASDEEIIEQVKKRVEMGDDEAIFELGYYYFEGMHGLPQDSAKAVELWHQAGELGCAASYNNIGTAYDNGEGVERDEKKASHYYELAAMRGDVVARYNLGITEKEADNTDRALKHFMIAVGFGDDNSLKMIQQMYVKGHATKDDYAKALRVYQAYLDEIRSDQRDKAAAFSDDYLYY